MGPTQSRLGLRTHVLDVSGALRGEVLQMRWGYSRNLHERTTIESLADGFAAVLQEMVLAAQAVEIGDVSPGPE